MMERKSSRPRRTRVAAIAALLGLALAPIAAEARQGLTVTRGSWDNGLPAYVLSGSIEIGDAAHLKKAIKENQGGPIVAIMDSPGGNLAEALKMGRMLKEAGATTFVPSWGICASACFYAYAGGTTRYAGEGAKLGVHQFSYAETLVEDANATAKDAQNLIAEINLYLMSTGVSPLVGTLAGTVPPDEMLYFDYEDWSKLGIVTHYARDRGYKATAKAAEISDGVPLSRYDKDPGSIDWCNVPVFTANGTFEKDPSACAN